MAADGWTSRLVPADPGLSMALPEQLRCPEHQAGLTLESGAPPAGPPSLACPSGCRYPVLRGIPRFVQSSGYAASFGLQWNAYRTTQLDSHTGVPVSRDRLAHCLGGSLDVVRGKTVLEAGCGAGRFTEVLLRAGARVFSFDLSNAVEANYANCRRHADYFVCQADILRAPVAPASFDVVVCLGVIQHTPSPEQSMVELARFVRPGGLLAIDHYPPNYPENTARRLLRRTMLRVPPHVSLGLIRTMSRVLLPLHRMLRPPSRWRGQLRLRSCLLRLSPLLDYYDMYPDLPRHTLEAWMELDTHDTLTDRYKHLRSREQITACLRSCGLSDVEAEYGGNGVVARARRPA